MRRNLLIAGGASAALIATVAIAQTGTDNTTAPGTMSNAGTTDRDAMNNGTSGTYGSGTASDQGMSGNANGTMSDNGNMNTGTSGSGTMSAGERG